MYCFDKKRASQGGSCYGQQLKKLEFASIKEIVA